MTTFTNVPKQVEELLAQYDGTLSRRNFIKGSGLLVVSVGVAAAVGPFAADAGAQQLHRQFPGEGCGQMRVVTVA